MSIRVIKPLAMITFKEGVRNRSLYGIVLLSALLLVVNQLICSMIMREVGKVAVDVALATVSLSGLLLVLFVGINLLAKDLDRRTIYMVLSRPVSRGEYLIGKFIGMSLLLLVALLVLGGGAILSIAMVKFSYSGYFTSFSWGAVILAMLLSFVGLLVLTALSFLYSTVTSTSFVTLVLTVVTYLIGQSLADVKALVEAPEAVGITVSPLMKMVVEVAYYVLPNLSYFDTKTQAAHGVFIGWTSVFATVGYGLVYVVLSLSAAVIFFRRREFP